MLPPAASTPSKIELPDLLIVCPTRFPPMHARHGPRSLTQCGKPGLHRQIERPTSSSAAKPDAKPRASMYATSSIGGRNFACASECATGRRRALERGVMPVRDVCAAEGATDGAAAVRAEGAATSSATRRGVMNAGCWARTAVCMCAWRGGALHEGAMH